MNLYFVLHINIQHLCRKDRRSVLLFCSIMVAVYSDHDTKRVDYFWWKKRDFSTVKIYRINICVIMCVCECV